MGTVESYKVQTISIRGEASKYGSDRDGWDIPVAVDVLETYGKSFVGGYGFLPSPYITMGKAYKYFGCRIWISAPWAITTVAMLCPVCFLGDDDDESSDSWNERESDDDYESFADVLVTWLSAFSGGTSIIEQIPIWKNIRIGFEQYIARSFRLFSKDEDAAVEVGLGGYLSLNFRYLSVGFDVHYGFMDFDTNRERMAASVNVSFHRGLEFD